MSFFIVCLLVAFDANAAINFMPKKFKTVTSHEDVYPYILNNAQPTNKKTTTSTNTINTVSATPIGKRGTIKRTTNARAATTVDNAYSYNPPSSRRVVPRSNSVTVRSATNTNSNMRTSDGRDVQNVSTRTTATVRTRSATPTRATTNNNSSAKERVSAKRCFSDYKECMESYCQHEETPYNRCYCSAKLSQIDAKYQNKIDDLIQQIVRLKYNTPNATSEEIKEYWDKTIGVYTEDNPWVNIDNALNIEWADTQSRVRGQKAFNTGHEYCSQHLQACYYMASNMRDAYKSEIARDCEAYEKSLQKIQNAAESVIESYKN